MIMSQEEWHDATAAGFLTEEHVVGRITNILNVILGNGSELGFDGDGFLVSLVADGLQLQGGITLQVYSNDHPPPHVHVLLRAHPEIKLRLRLDNGEPLDAAPVRTKDLRRFQAAVVQHSDVLTRWWAKSAAASAM